jgi:hypothetical protein
VDGKAFAETEEVRKLAEWTGSRPCHGFYKQNIRKLKRVPTMTKEIAEQIQDILEPGEQTTAHDLRLQLADAYPQLGRDRMMLNRAMKAAGLNKTDRDGVRHVWTRIR